MQDALCAGMQRFMDTEIQVEACLVSGCMDFWMQDALLHGCRDTGGSMPRYIDARICGCRMHCVHGCRDTWIQRYRRKHALLLDARIFVCRMHWVEACLDTLMLGGVDAGCIIARMQRCMDAEIRLEACLDAWLHGLGRMRC
jgi:hypothetical protein